MYGYFELDYGYTLGRKKFDDLSYHNLSAAFTRRYFDLISNSVRVIYNVGQDPDHGERRTADGVLILIENSLISPLPLTLIPYFNAFAGFNKPQSLARAAAANWPPGQLRPDKRRRTADYAPTYKTSHGGTGLTEKISDG